MMLSCDNNYTTWMFNYLLVVVLLIQLQHVEFVTPTAAVAEHVSVTELLRRSGGSSHKTPLQHSLNRQNVGSVDVGVGVGVGDDEVDFSAYVNDFNMQDETSIPEDILDQQHIGDVDDIIDAAADSSSGSSNIQYAGDSEAADIILESQRSSSTSKNCTSYDVKANKSSTSRRNNKNNNGNSSSSSNSSNAQKNKNNANKNHYNQFKNNKNIDDNDDENVDYDFNYSQDEHEDVDAVTDADAGNVDDMKDVISTEFVSSISNKKLEDSMQNSQGKPKQKEKQQQKQQQQQQLYQKQKQQQRQHQQQMETIVKLNERKFNKVSLEKNSKGDYNENINDENASGSNNRNYNKNNNNKNSKYNSINPKNNFDDDDDDGDADGKNDGIKLDESAIGDIEDNFRNEDETFADAAAAFTVVDIDVEDNDNNNDEQPEKDTAIDKYKSVATATEGHHHQVTEIENIAEDTNAKVSTNLIGRKIKRNHGTATATATTRIQFNDDFKSRAKFRRHRYNNNDGDDDGHGDEKENNNNKYNEKQAEKSSTELLQYQQENNNNNNKQDDDYKRKVYFGTLANVSNTSEDTPNYSNEPPLEQQQLQSHSSGTGFGSSKTNHVTVAAPIHFEDENTRNVNKEYAGTEGVEAVVVEAGVSNDAVTKSQAQSAFEQYKAQRRNNRRYGHKSHKKKYKDYLRYVGSLSATAVGKMITTTTTTPATIIIPITEANVENVIDATIALNATRQMTNNTKDNYQQQKVQKVQKTGSERGENEDENLKRAEKLRKYSQKIEEEKSLQYGLPASPIFVVTNRNRNVAVGAAGKANAADDVQTNADEHHRHHSMTTELPFYEGHINYFLETKDNNDAQHSSSRDVERWQHNHNMNSMLAADNNNWHRRVSPVLRNGIKPATNIESKQQQHSEAAGHEHESRRNHHQHHRVQHTAAHRHHQHQQHQHQKHNRNHHQHHHHSKQHSQQQRNSYQRKMLPGAATAATKHSLSSSTFSALHPWKTVLTENKVHTSHSTALSEEHQQTPLPPPAYKQQQKHAGAMEELGHQITDMKEFERYYAKWPHLARVESQVYNEHYRDTYPDLYTEYSDYESAAELEEAENANDEEANLPPYIKKYNRRNKQLLDLLEGTLPPPTRPPQFRGAGGGWSSSLLQPGPHDSSSTVNFGASTRMAGGGTGGGGGGGSIDTTGVRIDDDYLKEKRRRYHRNHGNNNNNNNRHYQDLFAQQRASSTESTVLQNDSKQHKSTSATPTQHHPANQLPDENVSISLEELEEEQMRANNDDIWQKEIENKSNANEITGSEKMTWQIEKLAATPATALKATLPTSSSSAQSVSASPFRPATPKAAIFKLPSYPAIAGNFMSKPRSRSAQFAPSSGSMIRRGGSLAFLNAAGGYSGIGPGTGTGVGGNNYYKSMPRFTAYDAEKSRARIAAEAAAAAAFESSTPYPLSYDIDNADALADATTSSTPTTKEAINSFVYHRVIDASPRLVGAGLTGRKQRLPFVAITDRRLETSKKALLERQKDFEQNHFPMP